MKTIKSEQIENLIKKLEIEFLKNRKDWNSFNTKNDIEFKLLNGDLLEIWTKDSSGEWYFEDWYLIEK